MYRDTFTDWDLEDERAQVMLEWAEEVEYLEAAYGGRSQDPEDMCTPDHDCEDCDGTAHGWECSWCGRPCKSDAHEDD